MSEVQAEYAEYKAPTLTKEQIQAEIARLAEAEHIRSYAIGNDKFHTPHEGYAVLLEEVEETTEEAERFKTHLEILWIYILQNNQVQALKMAERMYKTALAAAYEAIQVAAMAEKYLQCLGTEE